MQKYGIALAIILVREYETSEQKVYVLYCNDPTAIQPIFVVLSRLLRALKSLFIVLPLEDVVDILGWGEFQSLLTQSEIDVAKTLLGAVVEGTVFRAAAALHISSILSIFAERDLVRGDDWKCCAEDFEMMASAEIATVNLRLSYVRLTMPINIGNRARASSVPRPILQIALEKKR